MATIKNEMDCGVLITECPKMSIVHILDRIRRFQSRVKKHVEDNYINFMPNSTTSDIFIEECETLLRETEYLIKNVGSNAKLPLKEAATELSNRLDDMREASLGLRISFRILKIDDLFQCIENSKATKDYLEVLDLLQTLKNLISCESDSAVDRLFRSCDCYETIKVKFHIQSNIVHQNLQQRFDNLVQLSEKSFPFAKNVIIRVSKDASKLQNTVLPLFQARYNPIKICDFILENCFLPMITKPVSVEYCTDNADYSQLNISYSLKDLGKSLRPSYKQVFTHVKLLLDCLSNINVKVSSEQYVFTIIATHIKERFLNAIVNECLMHEIPETMDDYKESTLVDDVLNFEHILADAFFIDPHTDRNLTEFTQTFDTYFEEHLYKKILESARDIMQKDLQDMVQIAEGNTSEEVEKNPFLFPQCMISKNILELEKLMKSVMDSSVNIAGNGTNNFLTIIPVILNTYVKDVPKIHEKLLESIPQQAALFYNNCMFLAHWVIKNGATNVPTHLALVKTLQAIGQNIFKAQVLNQEKLLMQILKEFDLSDTHSIGSEPTKLLRQCLRQMDLLKNVWINVLPDSVYNVTFCNLFTDFFNDIIKRILTLEDISATVATELSGLIDIILQKAHTFFKEKHDVSRVPCWPKLQQLKMILNSSLQEITEQWCSGSGILTANYKPEEIRHLIRALFQNTDRRAKALSTII